MSRGTRDDGRGRLPARGFVTAERTVQLSQRRRGRPDTDGGATCLERRQIGGGTVGRLDGPPEQVVDPGSNGRDRENPENTSVVECDYVAAHVDSTPPPQKKIACITQNKRTTKKTIKLLSTLQCVKLRGVVVEEEEAITPHPIRYVMLHIFKKKNV